MARKGEQGTGARIEALEKYIWSQQGKCESIAEINRQLIKQYCRFLVLSEQASESLVTETDADEIELLVRKYQQFNKIALGLYKVLKFDTIKDELACLGNPYTELFKEAERDGDF